MWFACFCDYIIVNSALPNLVQFMSLNLGLNFVLIDPQSENLSVQH